jgi:predicted esterase
MTAWCVVRLSALFRGFPRERALTPRPRFDVKGFNGVPKDEDQEGMLASVAKLDELIDAEISGGIPSERIVVGGFSQGE